MKNNTLDAIILTIIFFGILSMGNLAYRELLYGGICSTFSIVPACYLALGYTILLFIFQIFKRFDILFIALTGFALTHSLFGSVGHLRGKIECPISEIGIPTCFIVFFMFLVLLILKFVQVRVERRT